MKKSFIYQLLPGIGFMILAFSASSQDMLREGEGRDAVLLSCTQCHGLNRLTDVSLTATEWENALYDMIARGAIVEAKDLDTVREYLINTFATDR